MHRFFTLIALSLCFLAALLQGAELVCARCHPQETARYLASPMGQSLQPARDLAGGTVHHARSASTIFIERTKEGMVHRLDSHGFQASYPVPWQMGAGLLAHSYVVRIDNYLFESPATWYRRGGWDLSPGYEQARAIDFDRPITETCLFCHASGAQFSDADGRKLQEANLVPIGCERCHGPTAAHASHPSRTNIVNPAKLPQRARDSVCEQCHLEGEVRVLQPVGRWSDFVPGDDITKTVATYVWNTASDVKPVTQTEQLAESLCARSSKGRLWCGTCHSPHGTVTDRASSIRKVCVSCHSNLAARPEHVAAKNCVSCHMPNVPTNYTHVAVTDHRIRRRSESTIPNRPQPGSELRAWAEPGVTERSRDLALAELTAGTRLGNHDLAQKGLAQFATLLPHQRDARIWAAVCDARLARGELPLAEATCREASSLDPQSADRAMQLGIAQSRAGNLVDAERNLQLAIQLDPSLKHAYVELWSLYDAAGKTPEMTETGKRFFLWNPNNIMFRVLTEPPKNAARPRQIIEKARGFT